jgi:RNA polymerase subunit RPABC4/transcription elongation factor Spt4
MNPIYCPSCKKEIPESDTSCPHCGAATTATGRALEAKKAQYLAAAEQEAQRRQYEAQRAEQTILDEESRRHAIYNHATGQGVCPQCKSPNVKQYTYKEGGSGSGQAVAGCLGCFFSPLAWLAIPFLQGKKKTAFECQYCSNRWSL